MSTKDNSQAVPYIKNGLSYADSGVDIEAGNRLVDRIKPFAKATSRDGVMSGLGGFGGAFDLKACGYDDPIMISGTDGVGTKLELAIQSGNHGTIGIDLVAMCVNDIITQGAEPLFFLDYFACGKLDEGVAASVIEGIAKGCEESGCALLGGETAEMPGMYDAGKYDLAGFVVGAVEREAMLPKQEAMQAGDVLIGLASSGVHSNGYSLVRNILSHASADINAAAPFNRDAQLIDVLLAPTKLYVRSCLAALASHSIKGMAHITGGGLTENIPRILPDALAASIDLSAWDMPPLFQWLQASGGVKEAEMLRTFNCGIGMVLVVPKDEAKSIIATLETQNEKAYVIGELAERTGESVTYSGTLFA